MARALVLNEGCGARLADLVYAPLEKEMLGAIKTPAPPFQRIFDRLGDIRAPEQLAAAAAVAGLKLEEDSESTHPPFGKRLANLGFSDIPPIDEVRSSATDQLLSPEVVKELASRFDDQWRKNAQDLVSVGM